MHAGREQRAARDVFAEGRDLALIAGAGTGKTATLILIAAATPARGLYIAFNRAITNDARRRFGPNVDCRTAHSLAFRAVGRPYQERLNSSTRVPANQVAQLLGITQDRFIGSRRVTTSHQARLVMGMIQRFCQSADPQVTPRHLDPVNGLDDVGHKYLAEMLLPYAAKAWEDIRSPRGGLRFEHDHYLKIWALSGPVLASDFVLLDEAQDTNPVLEKIFLAQRAQRVCVGDPAQRIYHWRGARDVMTDFPAYLERGVPVALTGGGDALCRMATAAQELQSGRRTSHPELFLFHSWGEVREYVEQDRAGQDLKAIVSLVDQHGPEQIRRAASRLREEDNARVTVSTAHKAKGREWDSVRVGAGFDPPPIGRRGAQLKLAHDEARLIYVAVTRARHALSPEGVAWIDDYEQARAATGTS